MFGQTPRGVWLEHVVLEYEIVRVSPVVRDIALGVIAHDVSAPGLARSLENTGRVGQISASLVGMLQRGYEAVHAATRHVEPSRILPVRSTRVDVAVIRKRGDTGMRPGI